MNPARNGKTVRRPKAVRQELNRERERLQSHSSHAALAGSRRKHTKTPCKTPKYTIKHTEKPHKTHKNTIKHDKTHEKGHPPPPSPRLRLAAPNQKLPNEPNFKCMNPNVYKEIVENADSNIAKRTH